MSDIKVSDGFVFDAWSKTDCHECSCEFQVTRSVSKTIFGPVLCDECKMHAEFNKERDTMQARIVELERVIREADDYLNINSMTSIGSGSVLHAKFKQALKDNS